MNATTTLYPATVQDLLHAAAAQGVAASELLASLPTPPGGFRLCPGDGTPGGDWDGPKFEGKGWKVTSHWNAKEGVTFYVDGDRDNAIPAAEAGKIAAALAEVAAMAG